MKLVVETVKAFARSLTVWFLYSSTIIKMKNTPLLASLICVGLTVACSESEPELAQLAAKDHGDDRLNTQKSQLNVALGRWVGHYQADTPCQSCIERCEGCEGTHVDLNIYSDHHYKLVQVRNAGDQPTQITEGRFIFIDAKKDKIQLLGLKQRNLIVKSGAFTEIYNHETGQAYASVQDFILEPS